MDIKFGQVFNLFDTNGRRNDVINALDIYLNILNESYLKKSDYEWAHFPKSNSQFLFYEEALKRSSNVFKKHDAYDYFIKKYSSEVLSLRSGSLNELQRNMTKADAKKLDGGIEDRARHYTSTLCKLGLVTDKRKITEVGHSFIKDEITKDSIEELLPLSSTNIILLRQLMKLRVYTKKSSDGSRRYYSPFLMAIFLLLNNECITTDDFKRVIQYCSPYFDEKVTDVYKNYLTRMNDFCPIDDRMPDDVNITSKLDKELFNKNFKNRKSRIIPFYYEFYNALWDFKLSSSSNALERLNQLFLNKKSKDMLNKAFGFGKDIFDFGESEVIDVDFFKSLNAASDFLNCDISSLNSTIYNRFVRSKYFDAAIEYGDTTCRVFKATGLFEFKKGFAKLAHKRVLKYLFENAFLENSAFGTVDADDYIIKEKEFVKNQSLIEILNFDNEKTSSVLKHIEDEFGKALPDIPNYLKDESSLAFKKYIDSNYPKEKVLKLMRMFADRTNDNKIKKIVNPDADVPTIFEYVTAIAWYYISNKSIDVYDSLNLTLNANYEPVRHASGNMGDIVVTEDKLVTMLEVTLLNGSAQDTNEYQPVLKHSADLKAKFENKETITFFVACNLYAPTIFNWRNDYNTQKMAPSCCKIVKNVLIMAFTNEEICRFIEHNITSCSIIEATKKSFESGHLGNDWRDCVVQSLIS